MVHASTLPPDLASHLLHDMKQCVTHSLGTGLNCHRDDAILRYPIERPIGLFPVHVYIKRIRGFISRRERTTQKRGNHQKIHSVLLLCFTMHIHIALKILALKHTSNIFKRVYARQHWITMHIHTL